MIEAAYINNKYHQKKAMMFPSATKNPATQQRGQAERVTQGRGGELP
jgi:hypothetical protein